MTSISIEYDLPFSALIDDGIFPESWLKVKIYAVVEVGQTSKAELEAKQHVPCVDFETIHF